MQSLHRFIHVPLFVFAVMASWLPCASAITVRVDYSTDTKEFFGAENPLGAAAGIQAKAAMDAAADFYSGILNDTFSAIDLPSKFYGSLGGEATWYWKRKFSNPETGVTTTLLRGGVGGSQDDDLAVDQYVVYVGSRELGQDNGTNRVGLGGPAGFSVKASAKNGPFTDAENQQLTQTDTLFVDSASKRGEATGFSSWGGSIAFDGNTTWHFNHNSNPGAGTTDFYTVALHELGHVLGLGTADEWSKLVTNPGNTFSGANAKAANGGSAIPLGPDTDSEHWIGTVGNSPVFNGTGSQKPLMVPVAQGRHLLTNLDAAALVDIGWEINLPAASSAATVTSEISGGGTGGYQLSSAAFSVTVVPEPSACLLMTIAAAAMAVRLRLRLAL